MTEQGDILFNVRDGIGRVTFNRPQARNAFTFEMYERVAEICEEANNNRAIKVLIFTGANSGYSSGMFARLTHTQRKPNAVAPITSQRFDDTNAASAGATPNRSVTIA